MVMNDNDNEKHFISTLTKQQIYTVAKEFHQFYQN